MPTKLTNGKIVINTLTGSLRRIVNIQPEEIPALAWSWLYVFALFLAYYVLRPIRDGLGVTGGMRDLPWLFTGTLLAMLAVNPLFAAAVRRWPRERFIALTYRFFIVNLLIFMLLMTVATPGHSVWVGRAFLIWVSVFNLFVVSVFWSFIVDVFDREQGKRLLADERAPQTEPAWVMKNSRAPTARPITLTYLHAQQRNE
ncbi:hypothetical protein [Acerihabitans arboris]|uniref:hypothetical protein n=1 Tax=Acerihabitans arboris TaxID=2691583 RepID=UPI001FEB9D54|nr:hypothetical protein [Acerihabitans arboris]